MLNWVAATLKETALKPFLYGAEYKPSDMDKYMSIDE